MKTITELKALYEMDRKANESSIKEYYEAKEYYHGNQLPSDVLAVIKERGQTPIIENIYKMIVAKILGYKSESIQEVKLSGRQVEDKAKATLLNDILKVFSQQKSFDKEIIKRDKELIFGMAVMCLWIVQDEEGDFHIELENVPSDCFIIDKFSLEKDASDARRFHRRLNLSASEARRLFGEDVIIDELDEYEPRTTIIESWIKEDDFDENGKKMSSFNRYCFSEKGQLYLYEKAPFKTASHPFVIAKYSIDEKHRWYGLFRDIKPLQDYINFAENRMANMMGSLKAFFEEGAVIDAESFISEASLDNAIVKVRDGALKENKIHFVQHHADISVLSQKANEKRNLAKILSGLNDEALGTAINRQSGVAIAQRRDAGLMGLSEYIKTSDEMDKDIFRKALDLIMHYFTKKQVFKIVDKKVGERFFTINDSEENTIKVGKFDLIYQTQLKTQGREERFAHWSEMLKTIASIRPDIVANILPLMLKDTNSPIAEDLEELLAQAEEAQAQSSPQEAKMQEMQMQLAIKEMQAKISELEAKAYKYTAQGELANQIAQQNANNEDQTQSPREKGIDLR
ncbi:portal protein [Campylobacter sp. MIT 19-121]|uniref:portal protein n=1 Tax=Campylobacter sp. MIT 19-121 TaxID=2703906 RepID=UPI00138A64CB|nr:portal protein [Campylobacter sp. MIT 19-121]NDJ26380.1 portal protein [Campylobacter sp. MIT 19-121]